MVCVSLGAAAASTGALISVDSESGILGVKAHEEAFPLQKVLTHTQKEVLSMPIDWSFALELNGVLLLYVPYVSFLVLCLGAAAFERLAKMVKAYLTAASPAAAFVLSEVVEVQTQRSPALPFPEVPFGFIRAAKFAAGFVLCGVGWGVGGVCVCGGVVWCGVVWCGVVWCGVVWCGVVWCGVVWCGVVWCGVVWCGVVWCGVVCGVVWCGVVWCGVVWCGVVWCGVVWCVCVGGGGGRVVCEEWTRWSHSSKVDSS